MLKLGRYPPKKIQSSHLKHDVFYMRWCNARMTKFLFHQHNGNKAKILSSSRASDMWKEKERDLHRLTSKWGLYLADYLETMGHRRFFLSTYRTTFNGYFCASCYFLRDRIVCTSLLHSQLLEKERSKATMVPKHQSHYSRTMSLAVVCKT